MKIAILGYSSCEKLTLTKYISNYYKIPLLYLNTVWWVIYSGRTKEKIKHYNNIL